jgi:Tol biopolymer transport system component
VYLTSVFGFVAYLIFCLSVDCAAQSRHAYASDKPISEPVMFGEGVISTPLDELNACFTPDGETIYYCINAPSNRIGVIMFSQFEKGKWRSPQVAPFSGQYTDYDPFISPDGKRLFFISNRPLEGKPVEGKRPNFDIWVVEKNKTGWSAPTNLGAPVNNDADQYYPSIAANGTLYFSTIKQGDKGGFDLYRAGFVDGKYTEPEKLSDAVNSQFTEIDACIAPDESFIVFASYNRPEELGRGDLYISYQQNGEWTPAKNLGEKINSNAREYCPILSPDGKYFFFTSFRGFADKPLDKAVTHEQLVQHLGSPWNGTGNVYQVDIGALHKPGGVQ